MQAQQYSRMSVSAAASEPCVNYYSRCELWFAVCQKNNAQTQAWKLTCKPNTSPRTCICARTCTNWSRTHLVGFIVFHRITQKSYSQHTRQTWKQQTWDCTHKPRKHACARARYENQHNPPRAHAHIHRGSGCGQKDSRGLTDEQTHTISHSHARAHFCRARNVMSSMSCFMFVFPTPHATKNEWITQSVNVRTNKCVCEQTNRKRTYACAFHHTFWQTNVANTQKFRCQWQTQSYAHVCIYASIPSHTHQNITNK